MVTTRTYPSRLFSGQTADTSQRAVLTKHPDRESPPHSTLAGHVDGASLLVALLSLDCDPTGHALPLNHPGFGAHFHDWKGGIYA